jgi:CheY-like chemotaxis protein
MPVMDGWEFLRHKERDPSLAPIPVVVVSGVDPAQARAAARGAAGYLQKPVDPGVVAGQLRDRLDRGKDEGQGPGPSAGSRPQGTTP